MVVTMRGGWGLCVRLFCGDLKNVGRRGCSVRDWRISDVWGSLSKRGCFLKVWGISVNKAVF